MSRRIYESRFGFAYILGLIIDELERAEKKYSSWPENTVHAVAIIFEKAGEMIQSAIEYEYGERTNPCLLHHVNEAIQTAAMALRFIVNFSPYVTLKRNSPKSTLLDHAILEALRRAKTMGNDPHLFRFKGFTGDKIVDSTYIASSVGVMLYDAESYHNIEREFQRVNEASAYLLISRAKEIVAMTIFYLTQIQDMRTIFPVKGEI